MQGHSVCSDMHELILRRVINYIFNISSHFSLYKFSERNSVNPMSQCYNIHSIWQIITHSYSTIHKLKISLSQQGIPIHKLYPEYISFQKVTISTIKNGQLSRHVYRYEKKSRSAIKDCKVAYIFKLTEHKKFRSKFILFKSSINP